MSLATDREAVLLARIEQLEHDVEAQRKALERATYERDRWRTAYLNLHGKVMALASARATVSELRNENG